MYAAMQSLLHRTICWQLQYPSEWLGERSTSIPEAARDHAPWNAFTGNRCNKFNVALGPVIRMLLQEKWDS